MIKFSTTVLQFAQQGEKTGWSYIKIPASFAEKLDPGVKKSFRVKGKLDKYAFEGLALIPMGGGDFIMALKADIRKKIRKNKGDTLQVELEKDNKKFEVLPALKECLEDEPKALAYFNKLAPSHKKYYSNWIESAKTQATQAKRIAQCVSACARQMHFGEMMQAMKEEKNSFLR